MAAELPEGAFEKARATWPGVQLEAQPFVEHVRAHWPALGLEEMARLHLGDLYLACACALHDRAALAHLDAHYLARTASFLARMKPTAVLVDDVRTALGEKLLVGESPAIAEYAGRGPLDAWIAIAAIRTALSLLRRLKPQVPIDEHSSADLAAAAAGPEMEVLRVRAGADLQAALRDALAALQPRERNVLRLRYLDGLGIGQIGGVYGVHRTTASRWIEEAQEAVLGHTSRLLKERLQMDTSSVESLIRMARSHLDLTLPGILE